VDVATLKRHDNLRRIANGVATLLGLEDLDKLFERLADLLPPGLIRGAALQELLPALGDAVRRVATELFKTDMWDGRTDPYRYVATVVAWLFLYSEHYGHYIRRDCPLFSNRVASEVLHFLATGHASCIADALAEELLDIDPQELGDECVKAG
jgi:hypothetical protein